MVAWSYPYFYALGNPWMCSDNQIGWARIKANAITPAISPVLSSFNPVSNGDYYPGFFFYSFEIFLTLSFILS